MCVVCDIEGGTGFYRVESDIDVVMYVIDMVMGVI